MTERTTPEAAPEFKQPSDTQHALDFNPDHLMELAIDCANIDTDGDVREAYYRALVPDLFNIIE